MRRVSTSESPFDRSTALVLAALATLVAGCSRADHAPRVAFSENLCGQRALSAGDVTGILRAPITGVEREPADAETCVFRTATHARIEVAVRPSGGTTTVQRWIDGEMPLEAVPLRGVGDRAVWQRDLHEVIAERNDVLCDATAIGEASDFVDASESRFQSRLGALCAKVLASDP